MPEKNDQPVSAISETVLLLSAARVRSLAEAPAGKLACAAKAD